ncbi:hypothetical protein PLANPX_0657 [Lacipirellula parvula]|uniref:Uncharacterized protein n=1 Tax=Lacipirellula parvula TaxID=2650471 RepID=A0A5K7X3V5_9BACT|nr:hypothetical protein PLANPX_0657 [Lacipirellula parvula]
MGTLLVKIDTASFDRRRGFWQVLEPVLVEAFLPQSTVE